MPRDILQTIVEQRYKDVAEAKARVPEAALHAMVAALDKEFSPPRDLHACLHDPAQRMRILAEFKRASPSKGAIAVGVDIAAQAASYARAGAAVVSVLTEPKWFKGSLEDMAVARRSVHEAVTIGSAPRRPLILRKDFIVDPYQLLEARAFGADTALLIVAAMRDETQLRGLVEAARAHGMEPLVEVNNEDELRLALAVGSKCVGVNNRNLRTFEVDLGTTPRVAALALAEGGASVVMVGLSGVKSRADVAAFEAAGPNIRGALVGETLMRAADPVVTIQSLLGATVPAGLVPADVTVRVKVCGTRTVEGALAAARAGADFVGVIFAPRSKRCVSAAHARAIADAIAGFRETGNKPQVTPGDIDHVLQRFAPLLVGVFLNQPLEEVRRTVAEARLDLVQLHGTEGPEYDAASCGAPVIRVAHVEAGQDAAAVATGLGPTGGAAAVLLDTKVKGMLGGTGVTFDWAVGRALPTAGSVLPPLILAGGLNVDNVLDCIAVAKPWGVDVASGVEGADGQQDAARITAFVRRVKTKGRL